MRKLIIAAVLALGLSACMTLSVQPVLRWMSPVTCQLNEPCVINVVARR